MAGNIGDVLGTTYNLPNFVGELFGLTPTETPILSMSGGLTGGRPTDGNTLFSWQNYDLADAEQPAIVEGADPVDQGRIRDEVWNTVQIFQKSVMLSYTKQAANRELGPFASSRTWSIMGNQPVGDELAWQLQLAIEETARDVEYSFINGTYQKPADNNTGRKTRGLLSAITTNVIQVGDTATERTFTAADTGDLFTHVAHGLTVGDEIEISTVGTGGTGIGGVGTHYWIASTASADTFQVSTSDSDPVNNVLAVTADTIGTWKYIKCAPLSANVFDDLTLAMYDSGAPYRMPVVVCGGFQKQKISDIYGYAPEDRNVGGVNIQQIETDLSPRLGIVLDRHMPTDQLLLVDMSVIAPRFLPIPGKGHFFLEPLAKTGSYDRAQLYGEVGLEYGPELWHGKVTGLETKRGI